MRAMAASIPAPAASTGLHEKDLVLDDGQARAHGAAIARRLQRHLTRDDDIYIPLGQRVSIARSYDADLFVSHPCRFESRHPRLRSISVYTLSESGSDKEAAALAAKENQSDVIAGVDLSNEDIPVASILIDLAQRDTMNRSSRFAETAVVAASRRDGHIAAPAPSFRGLRGAEGAGCSSRPDRTGLSFQRQDARQMGTDAWRNNVAEAIAKAIDRHFGATRGARNRRASGIRLKERPFPGRKVAYNTNGEQEPDLMRRALTVLLVVAGAAALLAVCVGVFYLYQLTRDLPSVEALKNYNPPVTTRVYAGDGTMLGEYARERRIFVPIEFVPKLVVEAFTCGRRQEFLQPSRHRSRPASARAAVKDVFNVLQHKRLEGASTITQQVAKNFLLNNQVKFSRKLREAILAIRIDATYSKPKILELYLNEIYLGQNSYGIGAASAELFRQIARPARHRRSRFPRRVAESAFELRSALPQAERAQPPQLGHRSDGR